MSKSKKNFQEIRRVMKKRIPLQTLKFTDVELAKAIQKAIDNKLKNSIEEKLKNRINKEIK